MCHGWLPVEFFVRGKTTKQAIYICKDIQHLCSCKAACIDVEIWHEKFPNPLADKQYKEVGLKSNQCEDQLPNHPQNPPFSTTEENIVKLKSCLQENFANVGYFQPCPALLSIFKARHNPVPVPFHFKELVRQALWKDVERGIIAPLPWCSTMVIIAKKNRNPWRTVDNQHLNSQCKWETHHTGTPLQLALPVLHLEHPKKQS